MTCHNMTGGGGIVTTSASEMHTRRIGLATCDQLALFVIMLNVCCIQLTVLSCIGG